MSPAPTTPPPLRKVAILVACLQETEAERLLAGLPVATATAVLAAAQRLGPVDPAERARIIKEFRRSMAAQFVETPAATPDIEEVTSAPIGPPVAAGGVELDPSLLARLETAPENPGHNLANSPDPSSPPKSIQQADPTTLARLLAAEHPQTIALVASRFAPEQSAQVLSSFSTELQAEVLSRMVELDTIDPQAVSVVEAQLSTWLQQQQQQQHRLATGVEQVQRILDSAPPTQQQAILTRLRRVQPALADRVRPAVPAPQPPQQKPVQRQAPPPPPLPAAPPIHQPPDLKDPLAVLEQASDHELMVALRETERQVVMLALAGASETLLQRITQGMSRHQAKQFLSQLRSQGPTRLRDMLAAQQQLAHKVLPTVPQPAPAVGAARHRRFWLWGRDESAQNSSRVASQVQ